MLEVFYSGGVGSTSVLIASLRTCTPAQPSKRLRVKMARRTVGGRYPLFYHKYIREELPVVELRDDEDVCKHVDDSVITVTGELGDQ